MWKSKKWLIIILAIVFFVTVLTMYVNRVIFPTLVKKIAIEQAQKFLKRKVEIGSLRLSWFKGIVVDKIKVYQKDSTTEVLAQAEQISFGIIFIPGIKQYKITIPFINIENPSAHLIRTGENTWNFSDLLTPAPSTTAPIKGKTPPAAIADKPSPFTISLAGITINNGQVRVDDVSTDHQWNELFDHINLKVSLAYNGIAYDFSTDIPKKNGYLAASGHYQPLTQAVDTTVQLKNIDTASYLSLFKVSSFNLNSGIIQDINLHITYSKDKTAALGDVIIKNLDVAVGDQSFKGNIEIRNWDAEFTNGPGSAKGDFALTNTEVHVPGLSTSGDWRGRITTLEVDKDNINFEGSLSGEGAVVLAPNQRIKGKIALDNIKLRKDKDDAQLVGSIAGKDLDIRWLNQTVQGDVAIKPLTVRMKDADHVTVEGDVNAQNLLVGIDKNESFSGNVSAQDIKLALTNKKDVDLTGKLNATNMKFVMSKQMSVAGSLTASALAVHYVDDILKVETDVQLNDGVIALDQDKTLHLSPTVHLSATLPIKSPADLSYEGTVKIENGSISGFPLSPFDNINFSGDFKTNALDINALSLHALEADIKIAGSVQNFASPVLNVTAESEKINLAKIKDIVPGIVKDYGLDVSGDAGFKVSFEGLLSAPQTAKIKGAANLRNVDISSSKFNQSVSSISGDIEASTDTISWNNFTGSYLGKNYSLTGHMNDFKNPKVVTSLDGADVQLKVDIAKDGDLVTINTLNGKYLNITFDAKGNVIMPAGSQPKLDVTSTVGFKIADILPFIPADQKKNMEALKPSGDITVKASLKGMPQDWKNWNLTANITSPLITVMDYKMNDLNIAINEGDGKVNNVTVDGGLYDGKIHAVSSLDFNTATMPFDLALNIDSVDMAKLKMDSPLKDEDIKGKFFLTTVVDGNATDIKNLHGKGTLAIRDGFLADFKIFKGLLSILNEMLRLGQVTITDVESNFVIENQRITTDNLRLKSPTIVLLGDGWVDLDQNCDLKITVDMTSGVVPPIAEEVLRTLNIRVYDKINNPKFTKKISVPQVINTLLKNLF